MEPSPRKLSEVLNYNIDEKQACKFNPYHYDYDLKVFSIMRIAGARYICGVKSQLVQ